MCLSHLQAERAAELDCGSAVRQLLWNGLGSWLAVATDEGEVQLWRGSLAGSWSRLTRIVGSQQNGEAIMADKIGGQPLSHDWDML